MNMKKKAIIAAAVVVIVAGAAVAFGVYNSNNKVFSLENEEINWNIDPLYKEEDQKAAAKVRIEEFKQDEENEPYSLNVAIAQQYELMGDGKAAYNHLLDAIELEPTKSLAYSNLGNLLDRAGAYMSAKKAFMKAAEVEPQFAQNHISLAKFLTARYADDRQAIEDAFVVGLERTGDTNLLKEYAAWLEDREDYQAALAVWEQVLTHNPSNKEVVEDKIVELKAKVGPDAPQG